MPLPHIARLYLTLTSGTGLHGEHILVLRGALHGLKVAPAARGINLHSNLGKVGLRVVEDTGLERQHVEDRVGQPDDVDAVLAAEAMVVVLARVGDAGVGLEALLA